MPYEICGISTNITKKNSDGTQLLEKIESGPVNHNVKVDTLKNFVGEGFNPGNLTPIDWLTISEQKLLELTSGKVFYDGLNDLVNIWQKLSFYPHDIWLYIMACQWTKFLKRNHLLEDAAM